MKDVVIRIHSVHGYDLEEDEECMDFTTDGVYSYENGVSRLSYMESEVTGLGGTLTTFQIEPERVTLMRMGEFNSQMVFEEGRRHLSMYETPYGSMAVGINTRHLLAEMDERGGDIEIDYAIEIDHTLAGRNIFQINVKESDGGGSLKQ